MPRAWVLLSVLGAACAGYATDDPEIDVPDADPVATIDAVAVVPAAGPSDACVADLPADARARWEDVFGEATDDVAPEGTADLDGDGEDDTMILAEWQCGVTGNCPRLVYVSGSGCWTYAGPLWTAYIDVRPTVTGGMHDLETWTKGGCAGLEGEWAALRWAGDHYEAVRSVECGCPYRDDDGRPIDPSGDPNRGRAPECPEA